MTYHNTAPTESDHAIAAPCLPNDILGDVIDILAEEEDFCTLKTTSLLSSFCLHHSQQYIFRNIDVSTVKLSSSSDKTLEEFISFFSKHPDLLLYVHHFTLHIIYPTSNQSKQSLPVNDQPLCSTILLKATNVTTLSLEVDMDQTYAYLPSFSPSWMSNGFEPIRALLKDMLCSHRSLSKLSLTRISDFPITSLYLAPYLRCLSLDNTQLIFPTDDINQDVSNEGDSQNPLLPSRNVEIARPYLESLCIDIMQPSHLEDTTKALLHRVAPLDDRFVLPLSKLKKLHVGLEDSSQCFTAVLDMLRAQAVSSLEELSIRVPCPMRGSTGLGATLLEDLVLTQAQTLKTLIVDVDFAPSYLDDPYLSLGSTLCQLACANRTSQLEALHIIAYVDGELPFPVGEKWEGLHRAFVTCPTSHVNPPRLAKLRKVTLSVFVLYFSGRRSGYAELLDGMRNTHLKELFGKEFDFELAVQEEWCG